MLISGRLRLFHDREISWKSTRFQRTGRKIRYFKATRQVEDRGRGL